ncbi:MAG: GNAT family N-acetyltransferase [Candidatus Neomarinimicrobiota bacterium]
MLRNQVLIESVGRSENCRDFDFPEKDIYIVGVLNDKIIATAIMTPIDQTSVQMRQVAVLKKFQRQYIGSKIVKKFEDLALKKGYAEIILHARDTALKFYESLDYKTEGDFFYEIDIPHIQMRKRLNKV